MRYVSAKDRLALLRKSGEVAHQFSQGVLVIGDKTTRNGTNLTTSTVKYTVDAFAYPSLPEYEIFGIKPDFAGLMIDEVGAVRIECVGLGSLEQLDYAQAALATLETGLLATFFEAPELVSTTASVVAVAGVWYEVLSGTTIYKGVTYTKGQIFIADGTVTATTGTGTFALSAKRLQNLADQYNEEYFAVRHLGQPDDVFGYFVYDAAGGYVAQNLVNPANFDTFVGNYRD